MSQVSTGIRSVLSSATVYGAFQRLVGSPYARSVVVDEFLRPSQGQRVLDIGCGPGDILDELPEVDYVGFDPNPAYIESAQRRHWNGARFFTGEVSDVEHSRLGTFDRVLAKGVLHHIDDATAHDLFTLSARVMEKDARLVTMDPGFVEGQSRVARAIIRRDRGRTVRAPAEYAALASQHFDDVAVTVRTDLLRIPFTHIILVCEGPLRG